MQPAPTPPTELELKARNRLALSLINQRPPTEHNWEMVRWALLGACIEDMAVLDRRAT